MNTTKILLRTFLILSVLFMTGLAYAQTDITSDTKLNMPNDWGMKSIEKAGLMKVNSPNPIPQNLLDQYKNAKLQHNESEKMRIGNEINKYLDHSPTVIEKPEEKTICIRNVPPFDPDWYNNDVLVYSGDVGYAGGYRQIDLKQGEDGWLYLAVNRSNVSGYHGSIALYRSSNGGANWTFISSFNNTTYYFGCISMLVEKRHATVDDSTRITIFFNQSTSTTFNDASLAYVSILRTGATFYAAQFAVPASGNKYEYPTACSDGMYYNTATYMHVVARECTNSGTQVGIRHFLTADWCISFSNALINTGFTDMYPSAAYSEKSTSTDSIYIAVERRLSSTDYDIRALITSEWPTAQCYVYYITSGSNVKYEKPCITVQQQQYSVPRRVLITCTRNNIARYHCSANGGQTWSVDLALGGLYQLADYTWCNSDSLTSGNGYLMACFVDQNGDSVTVRRGILGDLGNYLYKRNSVMSTGMLAPVCAIYKSGSNKYSAFAYAGQGPTNLYFNQENLQTGIRKLGEVPVKFELMQNYPNPFNPVTTIRFSINKDENVMFNIYDVLGNEVATIVNERLTANTYDISWDASSYSSGVYFYRIIAGDNVSVKKMMLVK